MSWVELDGIVSEEIVRDDDCCPALNMPTIRALGMPMAGNHNAPPVGAAGRCGR